MICLSVDRSKKHFVSSKHFSLSRNTAKVCDCCDNSTAVSFPCWEYVFFFKFLYCLLLIAAGTFNVSAVIINANRYYGRSDTFTICGLFCSKNVVINVCLYFNTIVVCKC